jgi:hypothetical protein
MARGLDPDRAGEFGFCTLRILIVSWAEDRARAPSASRYLKTTPERPRDLLRYTCDARHNEEATLGRRMTYSTLKRMTFRPGTGRVSFFARWPGTKFQQRI